MRITSSDRYARLLALAASFALPVRGEAAIAYDLSPKFSIQEEYNSNVTMRQTRPDARYLTFVSPGLNFYTAGQRLRLDGDLSYASRRYSGQGLDSNDWTARATTQYRRQTQQWSLGGGFVQNSSLQSELLTSGLVQNSVKRFERYAAPGWQGYLSDRLTADVNYRYSLVDYGKDANRLGLFGYRLQQADAGLKYQVSAEDRVSVQSSLLYYRTRDEATKSDDRSLSVGYDHVFSPTTRLGASLGLRQTETSLRQTTLVIIGPSIFPIQQVLHDRKNGIIATVDLGHAWRQGTGDIGYQRLVQPSGGGNLLQNDQVSMDAGYHYRRDLSFQASLLYSRSRGIGDLVRTTDYDYVLLSPSLIWRVDRDWSLRGYYSYGRQSYANLSQHAQRHIVGLTISYSPPTRAGALW